MDELNLTPSGLVPRVSVNDLECMLRVLKRMPQGNGLAPDAVRQECGNGSDVFALWLRASWLQILESNGELTQWMEDAGPQTVVFEAAANVALSPEGLGEPEVLLNEVRLRSRAGH